MKHTVGVPYYFDGEKDPKSNSTVPYLHSFTLDENECKYVSRYLRSNASTKNQKFRMRLTNREREKKKPQRNAKGGKTNN